MPFYVDYNKYENEEIELDFTGLYNIEETSTVQLGDNSKFRIIIRTKHEQNLYEGHDPSLKVVDGNKYKHGGMKGITVYYNDPNGNIGAYPAKGKKIEGSDKFEFLDYFIKTNYSNLIQIWDTKPNSKQYKSLMKEIINTTGDKFKKYKIVIKE